MTEVPSPSNDSAVPQPECTNQPVLDVPMLFEQYKLAVQMADKISGRRHAANNFFIGLLSGFGFLYSLLEKSPPSLLRDVWNHALPILATCLCALWWLSIKAYRRLNSAKWEVIAEMETKLPASPFASEWEKLGSGRSRHVELTKVEAAIPVLVGLLFLLLAARPVLTFLLGW